MSSSKPFGHNLYKPNPGLSPVRSDNQVLEWGVDMNAAYAIGRSSSPSFFTFDGHNARLEDSARGAAVMLLFDDFDKSINYTDVNTWGFDEAVKHVKPNLWTTLHPTKYINSPVWAMPSVLKIMPLEWTYNKASNDRRISHCPSTFYFRRHSHFNESSFFSEETIWFDQDHDITLLVSVKLAFLMGYRKIFINGPNAIGNEKVRSHIEKLKPWITKYNINIFSCDHDNSIIPNISIDEACRTCI